jgi:23S rRNA (pseudouridine1915-N3)-methyltransferase
MHIRILAIGERPPAWVAEGVEDFTRRMPAHLRLTLQSLATAKRAANARAAVTAEGERMLAALRGDDFVVALDERGRECATLEFARWFGERLQAGRDLVFLIGGPDGLAPGVIERADWRWSLSRLTFPHALVRILLVEQLYRAQSVLAQHPYHRE